jgi:hypothetical protein
VETLQLQPEPPKILRMGKKKKEPSGDRHKMRARLLRMKDPMWDALEDLAESLGSDVTHEIRTAVRERLERYKRWPWPAQEQADA